MSVITSRCILLRRSGAGQLLLAALLACLAGCDSLRFNFLQSNDKGPPVNEDSLILRPDGLVADRPAPVATTVDVTGKLARARERFRQEDYPAAEDLFQSIADNEKNPPTAVQEAMYYRGECLRLQGYFPKAADTYAGLLNKFPSNPYREQCIQRMFDIANRWLDDTRAEMREDQERKQGKRWWVMPRFVSFDKAKPFLDREGRAIEKLEQVRLHDIKGPLADQALFLCGVVKMYNENYADADHYFTQIYKSHKDSPLAPKAMELGIQCKHLSTGGSDYDGRKTAEARDMVRQALALYPEMAHNKEVRRFLEDQQRSIDVQQAEKDFKMAEFYNRTGHPGSAYFYYELVRRRYPNTSYARKAEQRWNELRAKLEKEQKGPTGPATPAQPSSLQEGKAKDVPPTPAPNAGMPAPTTGNWQR